MCQASPYTATTTSSTKKPMILLPNDFKPGKYDVICGLGKEAKSHEGNIRFRHYVNAVSKRYGTTKSKIEKTKTVNEIIDYVRKAGGGFVKFSTDYHHCDSGAGHDGGCGGQHYRWYDVGDMAAREKVGQSLRERNHTKYLSSSTTKRKMRKQSNDRLGNKIALFMTRNETMKSEIQKLQTTIEQYSRQHQQQYHCYINSISNESSLVVIEEEDNTSSALHQQQPSGGVRLLNELDLEVAMTEANMRILASLKKDNPDGHHQCV